MEIFKDIKGYEGFYQVSNLGNVKSIDRVNNLGRLLKTKTLKNSKMSSGYFSVRLSRGGRQKTFSIHKLVAIAFLNHKPCSYEIVVDHIDNDKLNNKADNLQLITQRENSSKNRDNSSGYTGVYWNETNKNWKSIIRIKGKSKYLGSFNNVIDAHNTYQDALIKIS
tara:strand:- start:2731 stop:3228 length:498 start_codon:yes stop_codon:yes gene_type:complete